ncbi:hypothetical protein [Lentzea sp. NPDC055074]
MSDLTRGDMLSIASIAIGILAIVVSIIITRRWGTRRARLSFNYKYTSLVNTGGPHDNLITVSYGDIEVPNPHVLAATIANVGAKDISSTLFHDNSPLKVRLDSKIVDIIGPALEQSKTKSPIKVNHDDNTIEFGPGLLRRKGYWRVEVIVSGNGKPELDQSLIDTDFVTETLELQKRASTHSSFGPEIALAGIATGLISFIVYIATLAPSKFSQLEQLHCQTHPDRLLPDGQACTGVVAQTLFDTGNPFLWIAIATAGIGTISLFTLAMRDLPRPRPF